MHLNKMVNAGNVGLAGLTKLSRTPCTKKGEIMHTLTNSLVRVVLNSGNIAIYRVQPQHLPRENIPQSREWPLMYGEQIAHQLGDKWFHVGGWNEITDKKTLTLLNSI